MHISFCRQRLLVCLENWFMEFTVKYYLYCPCMLQKTHIWRQTQFTYFRARCFWSNRGCFKKNRKCVKRLSKSKQKPQKSWKYLICQSTCWHCEYIYTTNINSGLQILRVGYCCKRLWRTCPKIAFFHKF